MFKVGVVLMPLLLTLNIFHTLSSVYIVNFEHVIAGWAKTDYFVIVNGWKLTYSRFYYVQYIPPFYKVCKWKRHLKVVFLDKTGANNAMDKFYNKDALNRDINLILHIKEVWNSEKQPFTHVLQNTCS